MKCEVILHVHVWPACPVYIQHAWVQTYPPKQTTSTGDVGHGPLARYVKLRVAHSSFMLGTFSPPPRVSDPGMHHGTCVMHVSWCMPGSLTSAFFWSQWRGKRTRHSRCMCNPQLYVSGKRPIIIRIKYLFTCWNWNNRHKMVRQQGPWFATQTCTCGACCTARVWWCGKIASVLKNNEIFYTASIRNHIWKDHM